MPTISVVYITLAYYGYNNYHCKCNITMRHCAKLLDQATELVTVSGNIRTIYAINFTCYIIDRIVQYMDWLAI